MTDDHSRLTAAILNAIVDFPVMKWSNFIFTGVNEFTDPNNIGIDTKTIKFGVIKLRPYGYLEALAAILKKKRFSGAQILVDF